ncbi:MAG: phosphoribosylaminoimidazolesuccinocarboxamide synthase [Saprospiraceae bacterium]|nr:phosphoribosylaminoimidazolesuccinocarboxamide synthase [Saprospiraceae bacterium]
MSSPIVQPNAEYNFHPDQKVYHGKVRDVYTIGSKIIMIASDRISAFDHILPRSIPYKGQVLNQLAAYFLKATSDMVPNWLLDTPLPNVAIGYACEPHKVEMVIRAYLAGHAARVYKNGGRVLCGVTLPEGLKEGDKLPEPIITPTTKASEGHDEDISREEILARGIVREEDYLILEEYTRKLFAAGTTMAKERGLLLVDTKYEFGKYNGRNLLIDEVHTPDSSRYYIADGYEDRQRDNISQKQLSKEFVREWLMANDFQGLEGQSMPLMPDSFVTEISQRYIELFDKVTGLEFVPDTDIQKEDIERIVVKWLDTH